MPHYDVITVQDGKRSLMMKVICRHISEKSSEYEKIWYTESDSDCDKNDLPKFRFFNSRWRTDAILENIECLVCFIFFEF